MTPTPAPRRPVVILEPPCPCRLPATDHVCQACGGLFDHADLVRVAGGFVCRVPCRPVGVRPGVAPWHPAIRKCPACVAATATIEGKVTR